MEQTTFNNAIGPIIRWPNFPVKVLATSGTRGLANEVCVVLAKKLSPELLPTDGPIFCEHAVTRFSNDNIEVQAPNVRGHVIVIIHTQTPPVSEQLIELFALIDAVVNAGPADILLIFPYMPYCRSDRKNKPRISTMGERIPNIINSALGVKRVLLVDPHDSHLKHYFHPTADEISSTYLIADYFNHHFFAAHPKNESMIVFPDVGAAKKFKRFAKSLDLPAAYVDKERELEKTAIAAIIGEVKGKHCVMIDDEVLTGGTVLNDAHAILAAGARSVSVAAIHPILRDKNLADSELIKKFEQSPIEKFIFTNTIPLENKLTVANEKFVILSIAGLLAEAIKRVIQNESLTALHDPASVASYRL